MGQGCDDGHCNEPLHLAIAIELRRPARAAVEMLSHDAFDTAFCVSCELEVPKQNGRMETHCVAGHVGLELRNGGENYPFEVAQICRNPAEFWLWRLFAFELRRWAYAARA
jgi:hypothetical protein